MSKKNKSGFEGFLDIVAKILIVMALLMGISLMASLSSNRVELPTQPTEPLITVPSFKIYTCAAEGNDYLTVNFEKGMTWADFVDSEYNVGSHYDYIITQADEVHFMVVYNRSDGGNDGYFLPDVTINDKIIDGAVYGSPDLIP